jgi:subtilisin family serine protease
VELFVANVFGAAADTSAALVMSAVEWAITQHCDIVSMSLQTEDEDAVNPNFEADVRKFEKLAKRALNSGTMLVACTGNASDRSVKHIEKAAFPARCPSVLAVGGVDNRIQVMSMSNSGAEVFGPGNDINSSTMGGSHGILSGTSMAAAFVSGVAALHAERNPGLRGQDLLNKLRNSGGPRVTVSKGERAATLAVAP